MENLKKIVVLDNEVQAQLLDIELNEKKIPHVMRTYYDAMYDGIFQVGHGWGHVEAPEEYEQAILDTLKNLKDSGSDLDNDTDEDSDEDSDDEDSDDDSDDDLDDDDDDDSDDDDDDDE